MSVILYNTLTRRKDEVSAVHPDGKIRIYECGLTPYAEPHIGHARSAVAFDVLRRWLKFRGREVLHAKNVTDVEDKIINRAAELGIPPAELVGRYDAVMRELFGKLNLLAPDYEPYATAHMEDIVALIARILERGAAYEAGGDVYFSVRSFPGYGKLSGQSLEDVLPGARVEPGERKRDPLDFVLWKAAKPGEPKWPSPWGTGRPGWHVECSAMSMRYLGETFDIHCGGSDLVFPHHEDEIAQSEAATGKPFVRLWVHTGWVTLNQEKMSKSLGNTLPLRAVLERLEPGALRLLICQTHYRTPFEWSDAQERQALETYASLCRQLDPSGSGGDDDVDGFEREAAGRLAAFDRHMDDDLATPAALAEIFTLARRYAGMRRREGEERVDRVRGDIVARLQDALGIVVEAAAGIPDELAPLVEERERARKRRDFVRADELRDELRTRGWGVEDTPQGPRPRKL